MRLWRTKPCACLGVGAVGEVSQSRAAPLASERSCKRVIASSAQSWDTSGATRVHENIRSIVIHILLARIVMPTPVYTVTVITGMPLNVYTRMNIHVITSVSFNPVPRSRPDNSKHYLTGYWFD